MVKKGLLIYILVALLFFFLLVLSLYNKKKDFVTVQLQGGLGNRVFQVFAGLNYAEKYNKRFVISSNANDINIHEQTDIDSSLKKLFPYVEFIDHIDYLNKKDYSSSPFTYIDIPYIPDNVLLYGYFQSDKYFPSYTYSIRTSYYPNTYFIHIRAGDYLGNHKHYIPLEQYYKKSIKIIKDLDEGAKFIAFSNDNEYARKILEALDINCTISLKSGGYDVLVEMANCAGGICANSSLSWLGAFYQLERRGTICMPSKWINTDDNTRDLYPYWATVVKI